MTAADNDPELIIVLKKIRYDLTDLQVKVGEALRQAAALRLPAPMHFECCDCHIEFRSASKLAEHVYHSHDGPLPEHWLEAERLAGLTTTTPDETETRT